MDGGGIESFYFGDLTHQLRVAKSNSAVKQIFLLARPGLPRKYWCGGLRLTEPAQYRFLDMLLKHEGGKFYFTPEEALTGAQEFQQLHVQMWR